MKKEQYDNSGIAIVCSHVATQGCPILYAERTEAIDEADSGWQFLCYTGVDEEDAKIWSVNEIIELEPSLKDFMNRPVGTTLFRKDGNSPWQENTEPTPEQK